MEYSSDSNDYEHEEECEEEHEHKSTYNPKYKDYMKNYMREYRRKQKLKQENIAHSCTICNQLCKENEVEELLKRSLNNLIKVININIDYIPAERIERIKDNRYDIFKYGDIVNKTIEEIIERNNL